MGGMISGTLTTCAGGDVTNKLKDATNTMALAVQLATVCGQDPVLQRGRTFLQSSERTCVAQATSTLSASSIGLSTSPLSGLTMEGTPNIENDFQVDIQILASQ